MKHLFLFAFLILLTYSAGGQIQNSCSYLRPREADNWCFTKNTKLTFGSGNPSASDLPGGLSVAKGSSSISDKNGDLLFYSDGMMLWDKNGVVVPGGNHLEGYSGCTQSSLFVPVPGNDLQYILFTVDLNIPYVGTNGLNYSVIDMVSAGGPSSVSKANMRLMDVTPEKIAGAKHANGSDIWVLAHEWDSDVFRSYLVTKNGLDTIPVISHAGSVQFGDITTGNANGYMKFSPDGRKLALAMLGMHLIEVFDFDATTGHVSNVKAIPAPQGRLPYGIEFSPDGNKLYFTTINISTNADNNLYQYDFLNPANPPLLLNQFFFDGTALQLAVDGKIYVARYKKTEMGVIENPNRPDMNCNYREDVFSLGSDVAVNGLPNFIQSYFNIPAVTYDTKCYGDQTLFTITNPANTDSWAWNFGDNASMANVSAMKSPSHQYTLPGDYIVTLTETFNGRSFTSSFPVTINPLPPKSFIRDSLYIFPGSIIQLDAGAYYTTYMWQNGYSNRYFPVSEPGIYNVFIIDTNCCQMSDTIKVILLDLAVPSAFTPNGDLINDLFRVKGPTEGIDNYHFSVFNQWGQKLWETSDFMAGWDGKYKGILCSHGPYTWLMQFSVKGNIMSDGNVVKRGAFVLLR